MLNAQGPEEIGYIYIYTNTHTHTCVYIYANVPSTPSESLKSLLLFIKLLNSNIGKKPLKWQPQNQIADKQRNIIDASKDAPATYPLRNHPPTHPPTRRNSKAWLDAEQSTEEMQWSRKQCNLIRHWRTSYFHFYGYDSKRCCTWHQFPNHLRNTKWRDAIWPSATTINCLRFHS